MILMACYGWSGNLQEPPQRDVASASMFFHIIGFFGTTPTFNAQWPDVADITSHPTTLRIRSESSPSPACVISGWTKPSYQLWFKWDDPPGMVDICHRFLFFSDFGWKLHAPHWNVSTGAPKDSIDPLVIGCGYWTSHHPCRVEMIFPWNFAHSHRNFHGSRSWWQNNHGFRLPAFPEQNQSIEISHGSHTAWGISTARSRSFTSSQRTKRWANPLKRLAATNAFRPGDPQQKRERGAKISSW